MGEWGGGKGVWENTPPKKRNNSSTVLSLKKISCKQKSKQTVPSDGRKKKILQRLEPKKKILRRRKINGQFYLPDKYGLITCLFILAEKRLKLKQKSLEFLEKISYINSVNNI